MTAEELLVEIMSQIDLSLSELNENDSDLVPYLIEQIEAYKHQNVPEVKRIFCPFCKNEVSSMDISCNHCGAHLMQQ